MNATQLLAHFDRLAEAPEAVPRLRRFILGLAVRGKLVEQDENDEPATELLKRIQLARGPKAKGGRGAGPLDVQVDLPPVAVPLGWAMERFGNIFTLEYGDNLPADKRSNSGEFPVYGSNGIVGSHHECFVHSPCIVVGRKGSAGALNLCLSKGCCVTDVAYYCVPPADLDLKFSFKMFHTIGLDLLGKGIKPGLNRNEAYELVIPIPPIAEQHRIVAKVDELMTLCDQLEAAQHERERRRDRLATASQQRLNQPADAISPETQREHARFHLSHLPRLTTRPEHIRALRQTILNLCISGRLIAQTKSDEPALSLLKRIDKEKAALVKGGFLKPEKPVQVRRTNKAAFSLPLGWAAACLQDVCTSITDGDHLPPPQTESGVPFLVIGNVRNQAIDFTGCRYVATSYYEALADIRRPQKGDILYTLVGSYGIPVVVGDVGDFCVQRHIGILRPSKHMNLAFIAHLLKSQLVFDQATECATGIAQKTVPLTGLRAIRIPVPPLDEQHRIAVKVDELMAMCDQLEVQLRNTQIDGSRLLENLIDRTLGIVRTSSTLELTKTLAATPDEAHQITKESRFMTTNPAKTVDQLIECIDDLGGATSPERLLKQTGLSEDVEAFYDLLRSARDSGKVTALLGSGEEIRRHVNAD